MVENKSNRVVITGMGIIGPTGHSEGKYWENILAGKNGISDISIEHLSKCYSKKYGLINQDELSELENKYLSQKEKLLTKSTKLLLITSIMAAENANISFNSFEDKMNAGVLFGSACFDLLDKNEENPNNTKTRYTAASDVAKHFNIHGETMMNVNACSAGNYAIGSAASLIKSNRLETAIVGGVDIMDEIPYVVFIRLKALSRDNVKPFDKSRRGTILSEGSGVLILESLEHALNRNAVIYGEILGYGMSNDAFNIVAPNPSASGIINAMEQALDDAHIKPSDIDVIAVHGTGTNANDSAENRAISEVFGNHSKKISATSIKSMLGHQLGAASAVSAATCIMMLQEQTVPPTINVTDEDDICFRLVKDIPEKRNINIIMNNAYAFGGSNCCIILRRWDKNNE